MGGAIIEDARLKEQSALGAYMPLASKIFASPMVDVLTKFAFMWSIIMSRLLFNVHVVVPTPTYTKILNGVYMRVLRKIAGCSRYQRCETDLQVRRNLKMPSIECILVRCRLRYVRRLIVSRPLALLSLLGVAFQGKRLPWVQLVLKDLRLMRTAAACCSRLPDPAHDTREWIKFMADAVLWKRALHCVTFVDSVFGCELTRQCDQQASAHTQYSCDECRSTFTNAKALAAHKRTKHGVRVEQRYYSNAQGECQVCKSQFVTHQRLLRHLCDGRRTKCWTAIQGDPQRFKRLSEREVACLDDQYRTGKASARKSGHSHELSVKPARTGAGKQVGHVKR